MSKQKNGLVPVLRFPEFLNKPHWKIFYASQLFRKINNKEHNSSLPILAITQEYGAIPREIINYNISVTEKSLKSYKVVNIGDFIISLRSFQGGVEFSEYKGLCSPAYVVLRNEKGISQGFFKYYFKTQSFIKDLTKNLEGLRDGKIIRYSQFSEVLLPTPSLVEQQKIADCLSSIDELIMAHTQKLNSLKAHKKALMQQLFPAEGETVPTMLFPEFLEKKEWKAGILSDLCDMKAGKFIKSSEIQDKKEANLYPCYGGNGLRGFTKSYTHEGTYSLIGRQGALCGNITLVEAKFHATEHAVVVTPKEGVRSDWLYFMLIHLDLNQFATGQAQPGLSVENLNNVELRFTLIKNEQKKISDCLSSLDQLIGLQNQKLESLKKHKKGLMQQLFPVISEMI